MSSEQQANGGREAPEPEWSEQYCQSRWCRAGRWYVRADQRGRDLWLVAEDPGASPWSVAASEVVCPLCGEPLAGHVEGVGDIEGAPPAAILSFLRTLDRAA